MANDTTHEYDIAVVGATGAVGREMLELLDERDFPVASLRAMASARSAGDELAFGDETVVVEELAGASFDGLDLALFSAGSAVSTEHAPRAIEAGAMVVDNTKAFRMDDDVPLVVPEVNGGLLEELSAPGIIANPNCSTIQMVVALQPLEQLAGLERVVVSTYQSASGAGQGGIDELLEELENWARSDGHDWEAAEAVFAHPLAFEALPHIGSFDDNGFTSEELKMVHETRKILDRPELSVASHCVRIPTIRSHSESLTVDLGDEVNVEEVHETWEQAPGIRLCDVPGDEQYPLGRLAEKTDDTWVGRLRRDLDRPETLHFWVVSDNLRKGAALNSIQIAEQLANRDGL
jgi:aspartate-semialdehyde dehydrogenase